MDARHRRLFQLAESQAGWWTLSNDLGDILEKRNTPRGSLLFAWPSREEALRWRDNLVRNHGAPLAGWSPMSVSYDFMLEFMISRGYNALILGELPDSVGVTMQNLRA